MKISIPREQHCSSCNKKTLHEFVSYMGLEKDSIAELQDNHDVKMNELDVLTFTINKMCKNCGKSTLLEER